GLSAATTTLRGPQGRTGKPDHGEASRKRSEGSWCVDGGSAPPSHARGRSGNGGAGRRGVPAERFVLRVDESGRSARTPASRPGKPGPVEALPRRSRGPAPQIADHGESRTAGDRGGIG